MKEFGVPFSESFHTPWSASSQFSFTAGLFRRANLDQSHSPERSTYTHITDTFIHSPDNSFLVPLCETLGLQVPSNSPEIQPTKKKLLWTPIQNSLLLFYRYKKSQGRL